VVNSVSIAPAPERRSKQERCGNGIDHEFHGFHG
jgi:hypothetical protein